MEAYEGISFVKYPMLLKPHLCRHIWGGNRLIKEYNKHSDNDTLSESWEVSVNPSYPSIINNGIYSGLTLNEYIDRYPEAVNKHSYSLLIKFIDSRELLSVQVHPDDIYAMQNEGELGKTEAWYILNADEGAFIYLGFKHKVTKKQYHNAIMDGTIEKLLRRIEVVPGNSYIVEAGTVHAIGGGITLIEIQENSPITYRAYDYNRVDINGKQRELHIDKALKVSNLNKAEESDFRQFDTYLHGKNVRVIAMCNYFTSYLISGGISFGFKEAIAINVLEGEGSVISKGESIDIIKGDSLFIPAGLSLRVIGNIKYVLTIEGDK